MRWISTLHRQVSNGTVLTARAVQAAAIEAVDRTVGSTTRGTGRAARLLHLQLDLADLVASPSDLIEGTYGTVERLVLLHHEFAKRLLEVIDTRDEPWATDPKPRDPAAVPDLPPAPALIRPAWSGAAGAARLRARR